MLCIVKCNVHVVDARAGCSATDAVVQLLLHACRRGENGELLHSTCCNNTASEHRMFERFMVDDLRHWATTYKVGGGG